MQKLLPEDNFWNILLTQLGLELIASLFYVVCGYLLFYLGMAWVGCDCGLGFHVCSRLRQKITLLQAHPTTHGGASICCYSKTFHADYLTWQNFRSRMPLT